MLPLFIVTIFCLITVSLKVIVIITDSMADDFSQSLTPPVSPFASDSLCELIPAQPPYFCCSETKDDPAGALSTESYTARGSLKRYSHFSQIIKTYFPT